ncbi:hypothetical protein SGPA1_50578 [Streptomyces misionensis JCM 4497]
MPFAAAGPSQRRGCARSPLRFLSPLRFGAGALEQSGGGLGPVRGQTPEEGDGRLAGQDPAVPQAQPGHLAHCSGHVHFAGSAVDEHHLVGRLVADQRVVLGGLVGHLALQLRRAGAYASSKTAATAFLRDGGRVRRRRNAFTAPVPHPPSPPMRNSLPDQREGQGRGEVRGGAVAGAGSGDVGGAGVAAFRRVVRAGPRALSGRGSQRGVVVRRGAGAQVPAELGEGLRTRP